MKAKNFWVLLLCMLSGLTVGYFIGDLCRDVPFLSFLNYSQVFGLDQPISLDLGVLLAVIKLQIKISLAGILGMVAGVIIYKKL
nr:DUF4321 domain-containing protein [uncultured Niameybacter sp.]